MFSCVHQIKLHFFSSEQFPNLTQAQAPLGDAEICGDAFPSKSAQKQSFCFRKGRYTGVSFPVFSKTLVLGLCMLKVFRR